MNIVIIEDELLTSEDLAETLVKASKDIRIVAVLDSVKAALEFFRETPPVDLIFSDIQLGDGLSFEIFRTAKVSSPIIFCTAYNEYALDAIRTNGIEYILKPFTQESIVAAIDKYHLLKKHFVPREIDYEKIIQAITGSQSAARPVNSILVYHRDKVLPISLNDVALFYVHNELTYLYSFDSKTYIVSQSLEELEQLASSQFFRINRQYLVNRKAVKDAHHYVHRKYVVNLTVLFKEVLVVSKNRATEFLLWLTR